MMFADEGQPRLFLPLVAVLVTLASLDATLSRGSVIRNNRDALALRDNHSVEVRVE